MTQKPEHIVAVTTHTRRGEIRHSFRHSVDYVVIDPEAGLPGPWLFSRNRMNLASIHDCDHGGQIKTGRGSAWARSELAARGLGVAGIQLLLLTQPRFLGYVFNPVSFWLAMDGDALVAVIAEVSTPFGDRHSYLCHLEEFAPIRAGSGISAPKNLHVSPFQDVAGTYQFNFDVRADRIAIRILHRNGSEGVIATLSGPRAPMTNIGLLRASLRRPSGAVRTILLIYWQALQLKFKGAQYRARPVPPNTETS